MSDMTPEARKFRATDAKQLLESPLFVEAFGAVERHLQMSALTCDSDDTTKAHRIVISMKLLASVRREITRIVTDGDVAEIQMADIERKKGLRAIFQR